MKYHELENMLVCGFFSETWACRWWTRIGFWLKKQLQPFCIHHLDLQIRFILLLDATL